jgi:hypothetical protein
MTNTRTFCEWIGYKDKTAKHDNQFCKEFIESKIKINNFATVVLTSLTLAIFWWVAYKKKLSSIAFYYFSQ